MTYRVSKICADFELVFKDLLRKASQSLSFLTGNLITTFDLIIDIEKQQALISMNFNGHYDLMFFKTDDEVILSNIKDKLKQESIVRNFLMNISTFIGLFNKGLIRERLSSNIIYSKDDWEKIYEISTKNNIIFEENCDFSIQTSDIIIFDYKNRITNDILYKFSKLCGLSDSVAANAYDIPHEKHIDKYNEVDNKYDEVLKMISDNISPTYETTIKGYENSEDRVKIKDIENKILLVTQFDESKDFTVKDMIKALMKFDLNCPVHIVTYAPAIGCYNLHINKVEKSYNFGFNKTSSVGIYVD